MRILHNISKLWLYNLLHHTLYTWLAAAALESSLCMLYINELLGLIAVLMMDQHHGWYSPWNSDVWQCREVIYVIYNGQQCQCPHQRPFVFLHRHAKPIGYFCKTQPEWGNQVWEIPKHCFNFSMHDAYIYGEDQDAVNQNAALEKYRHEQWLFTTSHKCNAHFSAILGSLSYEYEVASCWQDEQNQRTDSLPSQSKREQAGHLHQINGWHGKMNRCSKLTCR